MAALEILKERGYAGLAVEAVARRAGAGKTTIYRWWPHRAALAVEAFFDDTVNELAFPETGSSAEAFRQQLTQLARVLRGGHGQLLAELIIGSRVDEDLRAAIAERWLRPRQRWGRERMERAVAGGECVPGLQVGAALDALYGPLYARLFFGRTMHTDEEIDQHCDLVFRSIFVSR